MTGLRRYAEEYLLLLKLINEHTVPEVAKILTNEKKKEVTETAIRGRLAWGRQLTLDARWFLNNLNVLTKNSQRIRKFSADGRIQKKEEDEETLLWGKKK